MADIIYTYEGGVYLNITNKCPCRCVFCIRSNGNGLGSAQTLWHAGDPTLIEIKAAIDAFDFTGFREIIFCGYGEPFCAYENLIETCKYIRQIMPEMKIRINSNGLGDLINSCDTVPALSGLVDTISISLNAPDKYSYMKISSPSFGEESFEAMLCFAKKCKEVVPSVKFTVVDIIDEKQIEQCKAISEEMGIPLRVRQYT